MMHISYSQVHEKHLVTRQVHALVTSTRTLSKYYPLDNSYNSLPTNDSVMKDAEDVGKRK